MVVDGFGTVWRGTAFSTCPAGQGDEIYLRHSQFKSEGLGVVGQCDNGMITGRSHNRTFDGLNTTFTSQLIIHLPSLNATSNTLREGETVQCVHDISTSETVIGVYTIAYVRISNGRFMYFKLTVHKS